LRIRARYIPCRDVPQRHLDRAHSTALSRVPTELLDPPEKFVQLQRILTYNPALQKQRIRGAGSVPNLAQPVHALIRIDSDYRAGLGPGFTIVATRRSVIFNLDGLELVLTPFG